MMAPSSAPRVLEITAIGSPSRVMTRSSPGPRSSMSSRTSSGRRATSIRCVGVARSSVPMSGQLGVGG